MSGPQASPQLRSALGLLALMRCRGFGGQRTLRIALNLDPEIQLPAGRSSPVPPAQPLSLIGRPDLETQGLNPLLARSLSAQESAHWGKLIESNDLNINLEWAYREQHRQSVLGAQITCFFDDDYPPLLRLIPRPPPLLFSRGDLSSLTHRMGIAVVGTRTPSAQGVRRATEITQSIVARGGAVISGLALGIDRVAHRVALDHGGDTVAVLGQGLDLCYPPENQDLFAEILHRGGALVSEQPTGVKPQPRCLIARDRLQSGLSAHVWIAETGPQGGALHAGRAALAQGRSLALPLDHQTQLAHLTEFTPTPKHLMWSDTFTFSDTMYSALEERAQQEQQRAQKLAQVLSLPPPLSPPLSPPLPLSHQGQLSLWPTSS